MGVRQGGPGYSPSTSFEAAKGFYGDVLGLQPVMDHGWIITLADPERPGAQISLMTHDATAPSSPMSRFMWMTWTPATRQWLQAGAEIVYPLTVEPWGVRRFFVRDPDGHVINVLSHP